MWGIVYSIWTCFIYFKKGIKKYWYCNLYSQTSWPSSWYKWLKSFCIKQFTKKPNAGDVINIKKLHAVIPKNLSCALSLKGSINKNSSWTEIKFNISSIFKVSFKIFWNPWWFMAHTRCRGHSSQPCPRDVARHGTPRAKACGERHSSRDRPCS